MAIARLFLIFNALLLLSPGRALALPQPAADALLDHFEAIYKPLLAAKGVGFEIRREWSDSAINAEADTRSNKHSIILSGGLLNKGNLSLPGLAAIACHELGHVIGGAPRHNKFLYAWFGYEGQADYFASLKCLKRVFADPYFAALPVREEATVRRLCSGVYDNKWDALLCERSALAGQDMIHYFQAKEHSEEPLAQFDTPSTLTAGGTYAMYPSYQCRVDTFLAGALCPVPLENPLSDTDPLEGTCSLKAMPQGARPACWFIEGE